MGGDVADLHAANVHGAAALAVADRLRVAVQYAAGVEGAEPAALVALHLYTEGEGIDTLARALSLSHSGTVRLVEQLVARGLARRSPASAIGARSRSR